MPTIDVTRVDVQPNDCALTDPLTLSIDFTTDGDIKNGFWELSVCWNTRCWAYMHSSLSITHKRGIS